MKEIYVTRENEVTKIYLIENYQIIEKHSEDINNPMIEGNIYIGKVQNVLPGMQAAFVKIGSSKNAFIHLKDLLPKEDIVKSQKQKDVQDIRKLVKPGNEVLVQVTKDENYKKGAKVTGHISFTGRFFVYMPKTPFITISSKIEDSRKREKLKEFFKKNLPEECGRSY